MEIWFSVFWVISLTSHATGQAIEPIWQPPAIGADELPRATVSKELVTSLRVGGMRIVLEETPLEAVQARFRGVVGHSGDAGDSVAWLCLHGKDPQGSWVLWLLSGEIHARYVGGFQMQRIGFGTAVDSRCTSLKTKTGAVEIPARLRLGMSKTELVRALGGPSDTADGDVWRYVHTHMTAGAAGATAPVFDSTNTISILFRDDRVRAFRVWKTTTS